MTPRNVDRVIQSIRTLEGAGFEVRRPFPTQELDHFDPFLVLDHLGPSNLGPGQAKGAPDHPHRGFETVTYLLSGEMEHRDSHGHAGMLRPGDVQWMTAGSGVIHSEMPTRAFLDRGGVMHGFQVWVNLPRTDKMMKPRYQEIAAGKIPHASSADGRVKVAVIAGQSLGVSAVIETRTPIAFLHFTMDPGGRLDQPIDVRMNAFAYVIRGQAAFGGKDVRGREGQMVIFASEGDEIRVENRGDTEAEFLLLAGVPLREPVARYGPFVMNTEGEIRQAFLDFQSGRFGEIPADV